MDNKMIIVGAGLCGTLLALRLAQRGYDVDRVLSQSTCCASAFQQGYSAHAAMSSGLM